MSLTAPVHSTSSVPSAPRRQSLNLGRLRGWKAQQRDSTSPNMEPGDRVTEVLERGT